MRVIIDAAVIDEKDGGEVGREEISLEQIGSEAWIRVKFGDRCFDIDYREFWAAARSVCIDDAAQ